MQFMTETGSQYELDPEGQRMRRLGGTHDPTRNQGQDGTWRHYETHTAVKPGSRVLIVWGVEVEDGEFIIRRTLTSQVTEVIP